MAENETDIDRQIDELSRAAPDDAARRLRRMPKRQRAEVAAALAQRKRDEVLALARYEDGTAGSLMTSRYADLPTDISAREAVRRLAAERDAETIYTAYVLGDDRRLLGVVSLRDLLTGEPGRQVAELMVRHPEQATADDSDEATARRLLDAPYMALPVVDGDNRLLGIVTYDDAHRCLAQATQEDSDRFHALAGEAPEQTYLEVSVWAEIRRRVPWILALAVVGLLAGYVVHSYESALDALVILALYMPMIADTGGNVGTQSASLVIRAIATGEVALANGLRVLWKECRIAAALAFALFAFAFLKVLVYSGGSSVPVGLSLEMIALAVALAIAVQVFLSTLLGATLPLVAVAVKQDPAVVAGPALTTIVDVVGLLLYFTITTSLLGLSVS